MTYFEQYEIPPILPASEGVGQGVNVLSQATNNTPYQGGQVSGNLNSRVESLEKYVQDLYANYIKSGSNAILNNLTITNNLTAQFGKIGNWFLQGGNLSAPGITLDANNESIVLGSSDMIMLDGKNLTIKSSNYVQGLSGFSISPYLAEFENIIARGVLRGSTFANDQISAVGGQLMVANADSLADDFNPEDTTLTIKGDTTFSENDFVVMRGLTSTGIKEEWLKITDDTNAPTYSVTRDLAGLNPTKPNWKAGTPIVKQGAWSATSGNAYDPATLTGGTDVVLANFETIALGDNNGAFKLIVDETEYDNVSVDLNTSYLIKFESDEKQDSAETNPAANHYQGDTTERCGQTFFNSDLDKLVELKIQITNAEVYSNRDFTVKIREGAGMSGTILGSKTLTVAHQTELAIKTFTFDTPIQLTRGEKYTITMTGNASTCRFYFSTTNLYTESAWYEGTELTDRDFYFELFGYGLYETKIATLLQTAIQAKTSSTQTVVWDTDHFLITGVEPDYYINITAPSTDFVSTEIRPAGDTDKSWAGACISKDGKTIYANVNNDVYISTNSGVSWSSIKPTTSNYFQNALMSDNGSIQYILNYGYLGENFYRRMNGSWANIAQIYKVASCSSDGKYIFADSLSNNTTAYSSDYGANWSNVIAKQTRDLDISGDGTVLIHGGFNIGGTNRNVSISTNSGSSWTIIRTGDIGNGGKVAVSKDGTRFLIGVLSGALYLYEDSTLTEIKSSWSGNIYASAYNNRIYAGNYYTEDNGTTWTENTLGYFLSESSSGKRYVTTKNSRLYLNTLYSDISGAGYLDLADGISKQGGYGSGGWLRLIGEGTNSPYYSVFQRLSGAYDDYVETCRLGNLNGILGYSDNLYGIAIGDSDSYMTYDIENGLNIGGSLGNVPAVFTGTSAPATTPTKIGDMFVDTTNHKIYVSDGTTNSSDWRVLN